MLLERELVDRTKARIASWWLDPEADESRPSRRPSFRGRGILTHGDS